MRRREFIRLFSSTVVRWPLTARAQQPALRPTIGFLGMDRAFLRELQHLGRAVGLILVTVWVSRSTPALAVESQLITPDATHFRFISETKGSNKVCGLLLSAARITDGITLDAMASRYGPGDQKTTFGYEIEGFESKFRNGRLSEPKDLKIKDASISSDIFSSEGSVERAPDRDLVVYVIKDTATAVSNFTATIIKGSFNVNVTLSDGRSLTYVIKGDASLSDAADKWTKCTIQIAK